VRHAACAALWPAPPPPQHNSPVRPPWSSPHAAAPTARVCRAWPAPVGRRAALPYSLLQVQVCAARRGGAVRRRRRAEYGPRRAALVLSHAREPGAGSAASLCKEVSLSTSYLRARPPRHPRGAQVASPLAKRQCAKPLGQGALALGLSGLAAALRPPFAHRARAADSQQPILL